MSASSTVVVGEAVGAASPISPAVPPAEALSSEGASTVGDPTGADLDPTLDSRKSPKASQVKKFVKPATVVLVPGWVEFCVPPDWHPTAAAIRATTGTKNFFIKASAHHYRGNRQEGLRAGLYFCIPWNTWRTKCLDEGA